MVGTTEEYNPGTSLWRGRRISDEESSCGSHLEIIEEISGKVAQTNTLLKVCKKDLGTGSGPSKRSYTSYCSTLLSQKFARSPLFSLILFWATPAQKPFLGVSPPKFHQSPPPHSIKSERSLSRMFGHTPESWGSHAHKVAVQ